MVSTLRIVLFWVALAILVIAVDRNVSPGAPVTGATVKVFVIAAIAFIYMRGVGRRATLDHALVVGVAWLLLAIVAEMTMTASRPRGWFELLGSPDSALRNVVMIAWIAVPALFARRAS